jgi:hypothetical protein
MLISLLHCLFDDLTILFSRVLNLDNNYSVDSVFESVYIYSIRRTLRNTYTSALVVYLVNSGP